MATLELNRDGEWLRGFTSVSFEGVPDGWEDLAISDFLRVLQRRLEFGGFIVVDPAESRASCRGWHSFRRFRHRFGPVGTLDELTSGQLKAITDAIDSAEREMLNRWVGTAVTPT